VRSHPTVKQIFVYSNQLYRFNFADSTSFRGFCLIWIVDDNFFQEIWKRKKHQAHLRYCTTWGQINRILVAHGKQEKIE
jgi:hypothetical protein